MEDDFEVVEASTAAFASSRASTNGLRNHSVRRVEARDKPVTGCGDINVVETQRDACVPAEEGTCVSHGATRGGVLLAVLTGLAVLFGIAWNFLAVRRPLLSPSAKPTAQSQALPRVSPRYAELHDRARPPQLVQESQLELAATASLSLLHAVDLTHSVDVQGCCLPWREQCAAEASGGCYPCDSTLSGSYATFATVSRTCEAHNCPDRYDDGDVTAADGTDDTSRGRGHGVTSRAEGASEVLEERKSGAELYSDPAAGHDDFNHDGGDNMNSVKLSGGGGGGEDSANSGGESRAAGKASHGSFGNGVDVAGVDAEWAQAHELSDNALGSDGPGTSSDTRGNREVHGNEASGIGHIKHDRNQQDDGRPPVAERDDLATHANDLHLLGSHDTHEEAEFRNERVEYQDVAHADGNDDVLHAEQRSKPVKHEPQAAESGTHVKQELRADDEPGNKRDALTAKHEHHINDIESGKPVVKQDEPQLQDVSNTLNDGEAITLKEGHGILQTADESGPREPDNNESRHGERKLQQQGRLFNEEKAELNEEQGHHNDKDDVESMRSGGGEGRSSDERIGRRETGDSIDEGEAKPTSTERGSDVSGARKSSTVQVSNPSEQPSQQEGKDFNEAPHKADPKPQEVSRVALERDEVALEKSPQRNDRQGNPQGSGPHGIGKGTIAGPRDLPSLDSRLAFDAAQQLPNQQPTLQPPPPESGQQPTHPLDQQSTHHHPTDQIPPAKQHDEAQPPTSKQPTKPYQKPRRTRTPKPRSFRH